MGKFSGTEAKTSLLRTNGYYIRKKSLSVVDKLVFCFIGHFI